MTRIDQHNQRTFEAPTSAIVLDLVRMRRSVSSLLRKGGTELELLDMVANAVVAILQRILMLFRYSSRMSEQVSRQKSKENDEASVNFSGQHSRVLIFQAIFCKCPQHPNRSTRRKERRLEATLPYPSHPSSQVIIQRRMRNERCAAH